MKLRTNIKRRESFLVVLLMLVTFILVPASQNANAASACKPVKPIGKSVGKIDIGSAVMPIIPFTYPAGGVMEPQKTTEMMAMSARHMPLSSSIGTTVLAWHVNFNGCNSDLNALTYKEVGYKFKITDENGVTRTYKISQMTTVKKGAYKASWFSLVGPRKIAMFTCSGSFVNGHYVNNFVILAVPA